MTYAQLLITLEDLKKDGDVFMKQDIIIRTSEGDFKLDLAVTLPGREVFFLYKFEEEADGG